MLIKDENINLNGKFSYKEIKEGIESGEINKEKFLKMSENGDIGLLDDDSILIDGYFGLICNTSAHLSLEEIKILKADYNNEKERIDKWREYKNKDKFNNFEDVKNWDSKKIRDNLKNIETEVICKLALYDIGNYIHKDNYYIKNIKKI